MKLKRDIIKIIRLADDSDDGYVDNTHSETLKIVWEITSDVWAFGGKADAERRLQRNVTNFVGRKR